ncbi:MAG: hypothetical protein WA047_18310 [Phenylobacterium sp.]|uniref:hypothetical protein n=1 Tax=Phenylobacterium sp. TaxID=1871053 RepID=UPI003BB6D978
MRTLLAVLIITACAGPTLAQDPIFDARNAAMWQEQQAADQLARQRSVALENQVGAFEARTQTERRLRDLEVRPTAARLAASDTRAGPMVAMPSEIDAWMAQSNARVRAAAANRR